MGKSHNLRMAKLRTKKKQAKALAEFYAEAKQRLADKRTRKSGGIKYPDFISTEVNHAV